MSCASRYRSLVSLSLACGLLVVAHPANAVEPLDTFNARVGSYTNRFDTELRANGETFSGTDIKLHRDLGLDQDNVLGFVGLNWRPFDRHEFGFNYYSDDASATQQLQRDISFNNTIYQANSTVRSNYKLDAYEVNYSWWAVSRERWALGPRVGLTWYQIKLGLDMELDANGDQVATSASTNIDTDLPSPTIGAAWRWTPAQDWRISADLGYFKANVDNIDADVTYGRVGVEWYPWQRVGFLLDYTANKINASVDHSRFNGQIDLVDQGMRVGIAYRF